MEDAQEYSISQLPNEAEENHSDDLYEVAVPDGEGGYTSAKKRHATLVDGLATQSDLDAHTTDTDNPHQVTASQVGAPTLAQLTSHTSATNNPHSVTKSQVGLGNVDNTSDLNKPVSTATQEALDGKANEDHTHTASDITDFDTEVANNAAVTTNTAKRSYPSADQNKLAGIASGATANDTDANLKNRANHTGTQAISSVSGLQDELDSKANTADLADVATSGSYDDLSDTPSIPTLPDTLVESVVAGTNVTIDNTDPANPVISASGGGGGGGDMSVAVYDPRGVADDAFIMDNMAEGTNTKILTAAERTKLAGVAENATANDTDANLKNRANHTGTQTASTISDFDTAADARITVQKGAVSGLASLDGSGKVPSTQLPAIALTEVFEVADETAQLALSADEGDVAIRTDESKSYIHNGGTSGTMADWSELATPTDTVLSVNGDTGTVTLTQDDIEDGTTYKQYSDTEKTKLAGIEEGADVTDAANVAAAGALMASGSAKITVGATEPSSPVVGDLWVDTN